MIQHVPESDPLPQPRPTKSLPLLSPSPSFRFTSLPLCRRSLALHFVSHALRPRTPPRLPITSSEHCGARLHFLATALFAHAPLRQPDLDCAHLGQSGSNVVVSKKISRNKVIKELPVERTSSSTACNLAGQGRTPRWHLRRAQRFSEGLKEMEKLGNHETQKAYKARNAV